MEFYTSFYEGRPVRLSEPTRRFAYDSQHFVYGRDTMRTPGVTLDESYFGRSEIDIYDAAIEKIVREAPIRICPDEKLSGAATLGMAISHVIPATVEGHPDWQMSSVSHLTVDFFEVLSVGYKGIRARAEACRKANTDPAKERFYQSVLHCLACFELYHQRYIKALEALPGYEENLKTLRRVPAEGAGSFREAVQSLWFTFSFLRLCGNWPGIGRMDILLGDYLKADLAHGVLTLEEAREILAHLFIKGCEWIRGGHVGSGDAQHYQNVVLAGIDPDGKEVTNEVTYLVLDIVEELGISDFPITVRLNRNTDPALLRRIAEVVRFGGGIVAVYNEDKILEAMTGYGYELREARQFANDGCWEVQVPGKTKFGYFPFDGLEVLQKTTLQSYEKTDFKDFEELYAAYIRDLGKRVLSIEEDHIRAVLTDDRKGWRDMTPCTLISIFEQDCIQNGMQYGGGSRYYVLSPHIGGLSDIANSLYAIKKLVYEDQLLTLSELFDILKANWAEKEDLRRYVSTHYRYFGNDNEEADAMYARILSDFAECCKQSDGKTPIKFPAGVSTFGRQIEWAPHRLATPYGKRAGDVLAGNASPTPGTDFSGVTSIIKSYCRSDLSKTVTGSALDIQLTPSAVRGEEGLEALIGLFRGFLELGGFFMQPDVADAEILKKAQAHPEDYQTLSVRVSGWNARFATLDTHWQNMVIERAEKG